MANKKSKQRHKRSKITSSKKWFIEVRGSYLPSSWQGWFTYVPFIAYLIVVMVTIGGQDLSVLSRIIMIFGQFVAAAIVMTWIASKHS